MSESCFVGRTAQINQIEQHIAQCLSGQARVLLVQGLDGIGKTRFLEEVAAIALQQGMEVYTGRCDETLIQPYAPFIALMPRLESEGILDESDMVLLRRFFGASVFTRSTPMLHEAKDAKIQLLITLSQGMLILAQRQPMLIMVEDLHLAGQPALEVFSYLSFALAEHRTAPLLLVGSYCPVAPKTSLGQVLHQLHPEAVVHDLELSGLEASETRALLEGLGVTRPTPQFVRLIHDATHGIPLFIREAVHHAVRTGALYAHGSDLEVCPSAVETLRLPQTLSDAIADRIALLSAACLKTLTLASLLGDPFSADQVVMLEPDHSVTTEMSLKEGLDHGVLLHEDGRYRFVHTLIRYAFSARLSLKQRQSFHLHIAQALERLYSNTLEHHILEIAHHLVAAGSFAPRHLLMDYARQAGNQSFAIFAWSEAVRYYDAALGAAESDPDKADLQYLVGLAHYGNHDVGPALDRFGRAAELYRAIDDRQGLARALMYRTRLLYMHGSVPIGELQYIQPLQEVLDVLGETASGLREHILSVLSQAYRHSRQPDRANELAQRALELGHQAGDNWICTQGTNALGLANLGGLYVEPAIASWRESLTFARRTDDLILHSYPLLNLPHALNLQGALDEATTTALEGIALAKTIHDWGGCSKALSHLASVAVAKGDFRAAEQHAKQTMTMVERSQYPWGGFRALNALACASAVRGLWAEANEALDTLIEPGKVFASPGPVVQVFARVFRQLILGYGSAQFTEYMAALERELMEVARHDTYSLAPLCAMIELGALTLNPQVTERPATMLAEAVERGVMFSSGWCFLIPRVLGIAAVMQEEWGQAESHFQHAIATASYANAVPELARTYLDYARLIVINPATEDYASIAKFLDQAQAMFHEFDMLPHAHLAFDYQESLFGRQKPQQKHGHDPQTRYTNNGTSRN